MIGEPDDSKLQGTALNIVSALVKRGKQDRRLLVILVISLVMDVTLSIVTIVFALTLASQANTRQADLITTCNSSNIDRANDAQFDRTLLGDLVPKGTKLTPAQAAEVSHLYSLVTQKDAIRDCTKLYG